MELFICGSKRNSMALPPKRPNLTLQLTHLSYLTHLTPHLTQLTPL